MTPIEKNVIVVDDTGKVYEATYPKRAKGLVKNGRARFIDEHTICLACPPKNELEDSTMSENKNITTAKTENTAPAKVTSEKFTMDYCLEQIENIRVQTEYLNTVFAELSKVKAEGPGDTCGQERAKALGDVVRCRETTNQRLITFYEKMYDDLKPVSSLKERALKIMENASHGDLSAEALEQINYILDGIRHIDK